MKISYEPLGYRVLVEFIPVEKSTGIIIKASQTVKAEQTAQVRAKFLKAGPNAFDTYEADRVPREGDIVLVAKYGGFEVPGDGNELLRIYNDEDIAAVEVPQ